MLIKSLSAIRNYVSGRPCPVLFHSTSSYTLKTGSIDWHLTVFVHPSDFLSFGQWVDFPYQIQCSLHAAQCNCSSTTSSWMPPISRSNWYVFFFNVVFKSHFFQPHWIFCHYITYFYDYICGHIVSIVQHHLFLF